ncbi:MAG: glycosyltransferase [Bdellovibrionia bacterium]
MIKKILAIIVDYRSAEDAARLSCSLLSRLNHTRSFQLQVVHFDNGNWPHVSLSKQQRELGVLYQRSEKNLGYAGALNQAVRGRLAIGEPADAYLFLNSDFQLGESALEKMVQVLSLMPRVGAVGTRVWDLRSKGRIWGAWGRINPRLGLTSMLDWKGGVLPENSYIPGCCLLVRAQAYDQLGGLPSVYHLYFEETEFCLRLAQAGWKLWVERGADGFHEVASSYERIPSRSYAYYFIRNQLFFWKNLYRIPIWFQMPRSLYVLFREILLPLRRAKSWTEFFSRVGCAFAGLLDGVLFAKRKRLIFESRLFPDQQEGSRSV